MTDELPDSDDSDLEALRAADDAWAAAQREPTANDDAGEVHPGILKPAASLDEWRKLVAWCRESRAAATTPTGLVRVWSAEMARSYHPENGGSVEAMRVVNEGAKLWQQLIAKAA
jgi:hypothetical protein